METETYTVSNDTNQVFVIYEVGRFAPGDTEIELTDEQVQLMEDNAILKLSKVKSSTKSTAKSEETPKTESSDKAKENKEQN